jgi:hypothetical protein
MTSGFNLSLRGLRLIQLLWLIFTLLSIFLWLAGAYANFSLPLPSCVQTFCDPFALSLEDYQLIQALHLPEDSLLFFWHAGGMVISVFFFVTAGLIFWRRSDDVFALLISSCLIFLGSVLFTEYDDAVYRTYESLRLPMDLVFRVGWTTLILLLFYFPNGKVVPDRREIRWLIGAFVVYFFLFGANATRYLDTRFSFGPMLVLVLILGVGLQIYRYLQVSSPIQKQQTKWVLFGIFGSALTMLLWSWMQVQYPSYPTTPGRIYALLWVRPLIILLITSLPLTIAFSILRYRLFDIDLIIRRTLTYSILSLLLALVYFGSIFTLQRIFSAISNQQSSIVIVLSTLAIAALFNPLRRRVQDFIDLRFYRAKYDAERTLAQFAATARDEVDLEKLSGALLGTVEETMQPESSSLWLVK